MDPKGDSAHWETMKEAYLQAVGALALTFAVAACTSGASMPAPKPSVPPPAAEPAPPPPPPPPAAVNEPEYENYLDAPQTAGTWFYEDEPGEKLALFGQSVREPVFMMRCAASEIALARVSSQPQTGEHIMSVTTETTVRQLKAAPVAGRPDLIAARLAPRDPLLDAMAITKGRFAIEVEGERTLYLPAWVEITRVIEDCR